MGLVVEAICFFLFFFWDLEFLILVGFLSFCWYCFLEFLDLGCFLQSNRQLFVLAFCVLGARIDVLSGVRLRCDARLFMWGFWGRRRRGICRIIFHVNNKVIHDEAKRSI